MSVSSTNEIRSLRITDSNVDHTVEVALSFTYDVGIERLPVEILAKIFCNLRDIHAIDGSILWIDVTHVCQFWRTTALDAADLWTHIYTDRVELVEVFLKRSKQAPLDVYLDFGQAFEEGNIPSVMNRLLAEAHRFRNVQLTMKGCAQAFFGYPFPNGVPLLKRLSIMSDSTAGFLPLGSGSHPSETPQLCLQGLPALEYLTLTRWTFIKIEVIQGLVNPSLRSLRVMHPLTPHWAVSWSSVLANLPRLEELVLIDALPNEISVRLHAVQKPAKVAARASPIHLPHLTYLYLSDSSVGEQAVFLRSLILPPGVAIHLRAYSPGPSRRTPFSACSQVLNALVAHLRTSKSSLLPEGLQLQLKTDTLPTPLSPASVYIRIWRSSDSDAPSDLHRLPRDHHSPTEKDISCAFSANFEGVETRLQTDSRILISQMLCDAFALPQLRTLQVTAPDYDTVNPSVPAVAKTFEAFYGAFCIMDSLKHFAIDSCYVGDSFAMLLGGPGAIPTSVNAMQDKPLFPALELLEVRIAGDDVSLDHDVLLRTLKAREEAGFSLPKVRICNNGKSFGLILGILSQIATLGCDTETCATDGWQP
ncbi:hypothetical protein NM688_g7588 [Phlebia brevispora]|uniref:Uncharacterized protein n=1 Tax=Phlebia brevispora TaxID=194682 RepID=A0ACC1S3I7_9APHY|nr:hypothetical protein NM688_g7588 [Phlebia brevispora]